MNDIPITWLLGTLAVLIMLSGFFSGSETALMTLNRYRLRHLARSRHRGAVLAQKLLGRPDRLIGLILVGNNFVNIAAASIATLIGLRLAGEQGVAIATVLLTVVVLLFGEVTPKTFAALYPERLAFPAAYIYTPLDKVMYPIVWLVNLVANGLLRLLGVRPEDASTDALSREELRTVVNEAGAMLPKRHQKMLLGILDLEQVTVEDIMIPRNEIVGIDLDDRWDDIVEQLTHSAYTRLPVFQDDVNNVQGTVHLRQLLPLLLEKDLTREGFMETLRAPYFIPEGTSLNQQLLNFQRARQRMGLVVDEYGDILGLVTLEDILEEIVGEFTTDPTGDVSRYHAMEDGSYLVDGSTPIRVLNRKLGWQIPTQEARTLNGLLLHHLETIPQPGTSVRIAGHPIEIVQTTGSAVRSARIYPRKG